MATWLHHLTLREQAEVELARFYATNLRHGTVDHDRLVLIAKLSQLLDLATGIAIPPGSEASSREVPHAPCPEVRQP